jgi:hypothetical protein
MIEVEVRPRIPSDRANGAYDLLIYCIGHEKRSRFVATEAGLDIRGFLAFAYPEHHYHSYAENAALAKRAGHEIRPANGPVRAIVCSCIKRIADQRAGAIRIAIDISSFDRTLMADVYLACLSISVWTSIDILYAPAQFRDPSLTFLPVAGEMAVISELSGRIRGPHVKTTMIVGLGYEYGVALGVIEKFEPDRLFAFRPIGSDTRFEKSVKIANFDFAFQPAPTIVDYNIASPYQIFYNLYDITRGLTDYTEVIIAPGGPKIFSMIAIIVGLMLRPNVCVWRVSLSDAGVSGDVLANGEIVGITIEPKSM